LALKVAGAKEKEKQGRQGKERDKEEHKLTKEKVTGNKK
jgi:hypothetical protein